MLEPKQEHHSEWVAFSLTSYGPDMLKNHQNTKPETPKTQIVQTKTYQKLAVSSQITRKVARKLADNKPFIPAEEPGKAAVASMNPSAMPAGKPRCPLSPALIRSSSLLPHPFSWDGITGGKYRTWTSIPTQ